MKQVILTEIPKETIHLDSLKANQGKLYVFIEKGKLYYLSDDDYQFTELLVNNRFCGSSSFKQCIKDIIKATEVPRIIFQFDTKIEFLEFCLEFEKNKI
jgi:hypothetical protein